MPFLPSCISASTSNHQQNNDMNSSTLESKSDPKATAMPVVDINDSNKEQIRNTIGTSSTMDDFVIRDAIHSHNYDSGTNFTSKSSVYASGIPHLQETQQQQHSQSMSSMEVHHPNDVFCSDSTPLLVPSKNDSPPITHLETLTVVSSSIESIPTITEQRWIDKTCADYSHQISNQDSSIKESMAAITSKNSNIASVVKSSENQSKDKQQPQGTTSVDVIVVSNQSNNAVAVKKRKRVNKSESSKNLTSDPSSESATVVASICSVSNSGTTGRWTSAEHQAFVRGLAKYGREWKRVALDIPTRTSAQVRSHAQKYLSKMEKQLALVHSLETTVASPGSENNFHRDTQHHATSTIHTSEIETPILNRLTESIQDDDNNYNSSDTGSSPNSGYQTSHNDTGTDGTYQTMSDSVRQQAARILANPTTVEQEVRETIHQLRKRYQQLQDRLRGMDQQQPNRQQSNVTTGISNNINHGGGTINQIQFLPSRMDNSYSADGNRHTINNSNISSNSSNDVCNNNNNKKSSSSSSSSSTRILNVEHDDDELIALHVLQGFQKNHNQHQHNQQRI